MPTKRRGKYVLEEFSSPLRSILIDSVDKYPLLSQKKMAADWVKTRAYTPRTELIFYYLFFLDECMHQ